ncbi:MAG: hypothetical protein GX781_02505 [Clostridiales bacterium]|nr:hypothetical protein [Clostridiales bacterium]
MLRLPERLKRCLTDAGMLILACWGLVLPLLQIFLLGQEKRYALLVTCVFALVFTSLPLLKKRLRPFGYSLVFSLFGLYLYKGQLHLAVAEMLNSLVGGSPVYHMVILYSDLLIPAAILGITLYIRLLIQGEPSFSAPLLLSNVLMMWFSGARQGISDFLPAMVAIPMLYVYSSYAQEAIGKTASDKSKNRDFLKALPIALLIAALAFALTPPFRQTEPALEEKADQLRQYINDYFFFTDSRENFSLSSLGYQPMGEKGLGGKPTISNNPLMEVDTAKKVYLRGSILNLYNGRRWFDSVSNERYSYSTLRFAALRDTLLDVSLPKQTQRAEALQLDVTLLNPMPSTLFVPQRLRSLNLDDGMVPYLNAASELFITRNLEQGDHYALSYEPYIGGTIQTDDLALELHGQADDRYDKLKTTYTQLPEHLQPNGQVTKLAEQITAGETDPYRIAMLIRNYLKTNYTYTLDVKPAPDDLDFTSHFLFQTRQGYCTYFASAMTVLARTQGLPSRYVEGFVATPGEDGMPIVLTGQQAHAWTEIYIPAMGWVTFDATATTGEMPPSPDEDPDSSPPDGSEPEQTPQPEQDPEPEPSQEPDDPNESEQPSPEPTQEPESSPPPEDDPLPETGGVKNKVWLWILLIIASLTLFIWRVWDTQPHRRIQRLHDNSKKLLVYWQDLSIALSNQSKPMIASETLRDYALRIAPDDAGLFKLSDTVSGVLYGKAKADDAALTFAALYYQSAYALLRPIERIRLIFTRVWLDTIKHLRAAWQILYVPVQDMLRSMRSKAEQGLSSILKKMKAFIRKK